MAIIKLQTEIKKKILIILLSSVIQIVQAQTVVWEMQPCDYSKITLINEDLYKVERNGKIGLVHSNGSIVADVVNDNISSFYEGKALLTSNDVKGERVNGCLTLEGRFYKFHKKYYTLNGQKFFSDDVLSVADEYGKLGYVDISGNEICGFDGRFDKIKLFTEGYAAVFKNKKYYLIDKEGSPVKFTFKGIAEVNGGTNVYNGVAYIWDKAGNFYLYDTSKDEPCKPVKTPQNTNSLDYLYRFSSITGKTKAIPFVEGKYNGRKGLNASYSNGLYGYKTEFKTILPTQFSSASQFEDGKAIVSLNGMTGIIRYIEGKGFSVSETSKNINFYSNKTTTCYFSIDIPEIWKNSPLEISLKDQQGTSIETKQTGNSYSFNQVLSVSCNKVYKITILGEGLKLYEGELSYSFTKKEVCPTCGKDKILCPGHVAKCPTCGKDKNKCTGHVKRCTVCGKKIVGKKTKYNSDECKFDSVH